MRCAKASSSSSPPRIRFVSALTATCLPGCIFQSPRGISLQMAMRCSTFRKSFSVPELILFLVDILLFLALVAFLGFDGHGGDGARFQALDADGLAGFFAVTISAV